MITDWTIRCFCLCSVIQFKKHIVYEVESARRTWGLWLGWSLLRLFYSCNLYGCNARKPACTLPKLTAAISGVTTDNRVNILSYNGPPKRQQLLKPSERLRNASADIINRWQMGFALGPPAVRITRACNSIRLVYDVVWPLVFVQDSMYTIIIRERQKISKTQLSINTENYTESR